MQHRTLAGLTALALTASLGVVTAAPASAATDPAPLDAGADWLAAELDGARFPGPFGYGQSIDAVIALVEAGGHASDVTAVTNSVAADIDGYWTYSYEFPAGEQHTGESGGAIAKTLVLATRAGASTTDFGGVDLVSELEGFTSTEAGIEGRVVGTLDGEVDSSYTNTIIQALAVQGLDAVGSTAVDRATDYLVAQQCPGGYFREGPPAPGGGLQSCTTDAGNAPSIDSTGQALLALAPQADDTDVQPVIADAVAWLTSQQAADGSFGNANSTGLAAWALGELAALGDPDAAARGASWLRAHQADDFGPCTTGLTGERGAIALTDEALAAGRANGITAETRQQFVIATSQAVPALQWAPDAAYAVEPTSSSAFVRAGSRQQVRADDVAPGQTVCFARGASQDLVNAGLDGRAVGTVTLPAGTGNRVYDVRLTDRVLGTVTFRALAPKRLAVDARPAVRRKQQQFAAVRGLAGGESVKVYFAGKLVAQGKASAAGTFRKTFKVRPGTALGRRTVKVVGQFGDRVGTRSVKVTRAK